MLKSCFAIIQQLCGIVLQTLSGSACARAEAGVPVAGPMKAG
jgi:hypothetical protein